MKLQTYHISFKENEDEYVGNLLITTPDKLIKINDITVETNGVTIEFDEEILGIEKQ